MEAVLGCASGTRRAGLMRPAKYIAGGIGAFNIVFGMWALVAPGSFYETIATFPPYNVHFLHDVGAFQIGIGITLVAAIAWGDALGVALAGFGVGGTLHALAHFVDRDLGGRPTDIAGLAALAALAVYAVAGRKRDIS